MIVAKQEQSWIDAHQALGEDRSNAAWLTEQRALALQAFAESGLPGIRDEDWRYTSLRVLKSQQFELAGSNTLVTELPDTELPRLVFVDGHYNAQASTARLQGLSLLADSLNDQAVQANFGSTLPEQAHGFLSLNTAYAQQGYVLHLAKGQISDTIEVVFVSQAANSVHHVRNLIIAEANTQCRVVERHVGQANAVYLSNVVTEIVTADNAHVDHYRIQQGSDAAFHLGGVFVNQGSASHVCSNNIALSGGLNRNDIHSNLVGQGAHCEMNGLVLGHGEQHIDNHTQVNHAVPNCTSDEFYKTVLDDASRSIFRGRIIVAQDAQLTNADQQNNNLLLSANAEIDSKPQLEIYADDVKCSHGATVGQLDPGSVFYLKSRGINEQTARSLLTFAFANEVVERLKLDSIREEITQHIAGELLDGLDDLV